MTKKIVFISRDANWQFYRNEVLSHLAEDFDYEIDILTTGKVKDYLKENKRLKYVIFKNWFKADKKTSFFPAAVSYILKTKPYAVLALNNRTQLTEYLALIACKLRGINFVWWTHAYDHNSKLGKSLQSIKDRYTLAFLRKGDAIITFSESGKEYLVKNNIPASKIFPALNTLDTDKLEQLRDKVSVGFDKTSFLKSLFPDYQEEQTLVLLYTGRLRKDKKVGNTLYVLKELIKANMKAKLIIMGDGELRNELMDLSASLELNDDVHFAGAIFDDALWPKYFLASDLFVMPGYVGLAIVHAFAFDLPLITEDIPNHAPEIQFLKQGVNGYLTKENDFEDMAKVIMKIYCDKQLLKTLKANARFTIKNEASILHMTKRMNQALEYFYNKQ